MPCCPCWAGRKSHSPSDWMPSDSWLGINFSSAHGLVAGPERIFWHLTCMSHLGLSALKGPSCNTFCSCAKGNVFLVSLWRLDPVDYLVHCTCSENTQIKSVARSCRFPLSSVAFINENHDWTGLLLYSLGSRLTSMVLFSLMWTRGQFMSLSILQVPVAIRKEKREEWTECTSICCCSATPTIPDHWPL